MKTFSDRDLRVWEAYPSDCGIKDEPHIVFNCLSNRMVRPRELDFGGDEAEAEGVVQGASETELLQMLDRSQELR